MRIYHVAICVLLCVQSVVIAQNYDWFSAPWTTKKQTSLIQRPAALSEAFPRFDNFGFEGVSQYGLGAETTQPYAFANPFSLPYKKVVSYAPRYPPQKNYARYTKPIYIHKPLSGKQYFIPSNQAKQPQRFPKFQPPQILGRLPTLVNGKYTFRPYVSSHPVLEGYHNDPVYHKIRQDVKNNGKRLKQKEIEEGQRLHSSDKDTDGVQRDPDEDAEEKFNRNEEHENYPVEHEHHDTEKYPGYYSIPRNPPIRYGYVNQKLKYAAPNTAGVKISPKGYLPIKNHIKNLKSTQAQTFGEGQNDYPSIKAYTDGEEHQNDPEGYDTFDKQKTNFDVISANFGANFDEFNDKHHKNKPLPPSNYHSSDDEDIYKGTGEEEFVPIKMYAQVRHTESTQHLPREAAYEDAVTYDDVVNAPRLREAVKTSKSQTVYSEEGYEDNAYDHAGHLKHASNNEHHGGYVKDKEAAGGRYSSGGGDDYKDNGKSKTGSELQHGKNWHVDEERKEDYDNEKSYGQKDSEYETNNNDLDEAGSEKQGVRKSSFVPKNKQSSNKLIMTEDVQQTQVKNTDDGKVIVNTKTKHVTMNNESPIDKNNSSKPRYVRLRPNYYWKRAKNTNSTKAPEKSTIENNFNISNNFNFPLTKESLKEKILSINRRSKRNKEFQVPVLDFKETFLTDAELHKISQEKLKPLQTHIKKQNYRSKYPYYNIFSNNDLLRNSPLRYAQNLGQIPKKSPGGSEFYDSRDKIQCSDVNPEIDPIPDRIKNKTPDDEEKNDNEDEPNDDDDRSKRHVKIKILKRRKRDNFDQNKEQPRLKGLGDHIDCFKEKYFDENPLDSPFFFEDEIAPPEPIKTPFQTPASYFKSSASNSPGGKTAESKPISHRKSAKYVKKPEAIRTTLRPKYEVKITTTTFKPKTTIRNKVNKVTHTPKTNLLTGEVIKEYDDNNLGHSHILYEKPVSKKPKISLPNVIFEKYIHSKDPQMRLYGDVLGNIRANLKSETSTNKRNPLLTTYRPSFIPLHGQNERENIQERPIIYEAYTNKEQIFNPNKHIRIARNSEDKNETNNTQKKNYNLPKNARPIFVPKGSRKSTAQISNIDHKILKIDEQNSNSTLNKIYKNIGKDERKNLNMTTNIKENISTSSSNRNEEKLPFTDTLDDRRGELKYENNEEIYKNHKKYYSPVTVKHSITPEELNIEYLLKKREDEAHDETAAQKVLLDSYGEIVDMKKIDLDMTKNNPFSAVHRFQTTGIKSNPNVFDVTAYLPRPIYIPTYVPRYNISSKYNANSDDINKSSVEAEAEQSRISTSVGEEPSTKKTGLILRHTVERAPSVTELPEFKVKKHNPYISTTTTRKPIPKKKKRIRIATTTTARTTTVRTTTAKPVNYDEDDEDDDEDDDDDEEEEEPTTKRYIQKTRITEYRKSSTGTSTTPRPGSAEYQDENNESSEETTPENVKKFAKQTETLTANYDGEDALKQWKEVLKTEGPLFDDDTTETPYETTTIRKRIRRPTSRSRIVPETKNGVENHNPRIVEKTSTKRKKTVITNSKRYDNLNKRPITNTKQKNAHQQTANIKELKDSTTNKNSATKRYDEDVSGLQEDNKSEERARAPIKEESRFEEDVEEEEVIKEGRSPSRYTEKTFDLFQDPDLAKDVNKLSEPRKEDQHSVHSDVEVFRSDFKVNRGPKHGGNYKRAPVLKKTRKRLDEPSELDDLNSSSEITRNLHGGNYRAIREGQKDQIKDKGISARVLNSFAAILPITTTTTKPLYEKDPGKRLYFFVKI